MRGLSFGSPENDQEEETPFIRWVKNALAEIQEASDADVEHIFDDFTVSNYTETRTLDASTATLSDVTNFICTIVRDIQAGGSKR